MRTTRKEALIAGELTYYTGKACAKGHVALRRAATGECLACRTEGVKQWRAKHPDAVKKHNRTQYERHAEGLKQRARVYSKVNAVIVREKKQEYQKRNLHIYAKIKARRRAAKLQRTPKWLTEDDFWMMGQAYELAALRTKLFGFPWHVDHILPLQGKEVSGLHVPHNLQVIPGSQNQAKSNRLIP